MSSKIVIGILLSGFFNLSAQVTNKELNVTRNSIGISQADGNSLKLWYDKPATQWVEALPIGKTDRCNGVWWSRKRTNSAQRRFIVVWWSNEKECQS